jgi:hypothetical protein
MFGLIVILIVLAFGAISSIAGVDSRQGSTDDRRPSSPTGLS